MESPFIAEIEPDLRDIISRVPPPTTRPYKISYERLVAIFYGISRGTPQIRAAIGAGIDKTTWADWRDRFPELDELVARAEAYSVSQLVEKVANGKDIKGQEDWKAAAWLLERRDKEHFSAPKADAVSLTVNNNSLTIVGNPMAQTSAQTMHEQAIAAVLEQRIAAKAERLESPRYPEASHACAVEVASPIVTLEA